MPAPPDLIYKSALTCLFYLISFYGVAQYPSLALNTPKFLTGPDIFNTQTVFVENIGQYGEKLNEDSAMGKILFSYEGTGMPVYFTVKGLIHLQQRNKKRNIDEEKINKPSSNHLSIITMEWVGANPHPTIVMEDKQQAYHTYGKLTNKAYCYKKITYRNIYPGIDIIYTPSLNAVTGFEYSISLSPGADLSVVKMKYTGDVSQIMTDNYGQLRIEGKSKQTIFQSQPNSYSLASQVQTDNHPLSRTNAEKTPSHFIIQNNTISFTADYDRTKGLLIDPFVSPTDTLNGQANPKKATDIDFDYNGNVYVADSELDSEYLAKYSPAGNLLWRFGTSILTPPLGGQEFEEYCGWTVEKSTGNVYLGRTFRINTNGLFDNYIANYPPTEDWKMIWSCNNGSPRIFILGGVSCTDINYSILDPSVSTMTSSSITGVPSAPCPGLSRYGQDIVDAIIDPTDNSLYSLYPITPIYPSLNNKIFKHTYPYSSSGIAWQQFTGYNSFTELYGRSYLDFGGPTTNSANVLCVNSNFLFYWDGKNLKAFSKATGAPVGTSLVTPLTVKMQGGIYADECNNVFIGFNNGLIKVFRFNGMIFNDAIAPDISIPGYPSGDVYDLAYDNERKLLYACGNGFVGSFDISSYCHTNPLYSVGATTDCAANKVTAILTPSPPPGSGITYSLYNGTSLISSNSGGIFTGLTTGTQYNLKAIINKNCSGFVADTTSFFYSCIGIAATATPASCGRNNGSITVHASNGTPPYLFSKNNITYQADSLFTNLSYGNYTITVKDVNNLIQTVEKFIDSIPVPKITITNTPVTCLQSGTINVTGSSGVSPYLYSINGSAYQSYNYFFWYPAGTYKFYIKDAIGCVDSLNTIVGTAPMPAISATVNNASCGMANGQIVCTATGGTQPYLYSIDNSSYQTGNTISGLAPGTYTVYVADRNNCIATTVVTIINQGLPPVFAVMHTPASCANNDGTITVNVISGIPPFLYSLNGVYQTGNIFHNLSSGIYSINVADDSGNSCLGTIYRDTISFSGINTVTVSAGTVSPVCKGVETVLHASSNASNFSWSPSLGLNDSTLLQPIAKPSTTTTYYITASEGICNRTDSVTLRVYPLPIANAGTDERICNGNSTTLHGSGGIEYYWSPALYLNNVRASNPTVNHPLSSVVYYLVVKDTNGCFSDKDQVRISVLPPAKIFAGNDTVIVSGQPLPLFAKDINGLMFATYMWTPIAGLNNNFISNPVAILNNSTTYTVTATTVEGCVATDDIFIKVFKDIEIYVPRAFTPNNDGHNDLLKAIPTGIKEFKYFTVYNRFGQIVFTTTNPASGWDGTLNGQLQSMGTYIWVAEAIDYKGTTLSRRGTTILIR